VAPVYVPEQPAPEALEALEVAQMPKQAVSLNSRPRSLPSHEAEPEVLAAMVGLAALPPYRAGGLGRQFLAVRQPAALSPYQVLRLVVAAGPRKQARVQAVEAHPLA
jgi:hypothetical protein